MARSQSAAAVHVAARRYFPLARHARARGALPSPVGCSGDSGNWIAELRSLRSADPAIKIDGIFGGICAFHIHLCYCFCSLINMILGRRSCRHPAEADIAAQRGSTGFDPGCAKTRSDLVIMPCGARILSFFCSPLDHSPQNSGCIYTA